MRGLDDAICRDPLTNLVFLPAVVKSRLANSSEILASDAMKKLFESLRGHFDYIIVDLSPLVPIVDVVLCPIVRGCLCFDHRMGDDSD